jgi:nucleoside-diphosphate-sugar epimerase
MANATERPTRVLLTGARGRIGTAFREHNGARYQLRLGVHHPERLDDAGGHEVWPLEIADPDSCQAACRDMDVVVHLAGCPSPRASFYDTLLPANILGPYNILRAAADQGCRRVILASSVQAVVGYPLDAQVRTDSAVRPLNMYGVCKCFAEAAAHYYAAVEGLSCIVVRVGTFEADWVRDAPNARNLSTFVSKRDLSQLLAGCVETADVRYAIVHGVSDNRFKFLDLSDTRALLDYCPKDDAFQLYGTGLRYSEQWLDGDLGVGSFRGAIRPRDGEDPASS